jgi:hypothetical protein
VPTRNMNIDDIPDSLIEQIGSDLSPYTVGLVAEGSERAGLFGSATCVSYRNFYGLLTARHVIELFRKLGEIRVALHRKRHRFLLDYSLLNVICSGRGSSEESGPDIGLIELPTHTVGTVKSVRLFANLEQHREKAGEPRSRGLSCILGFPAERASVEPAGGGTLSRAAGFCGVGAGIHEYQLSGDFDYIDVGVQYFDRNDPPLSYGGVSGGGLWQAIVAHGPDGFAVTDYVLRGVAFHESAIVERERRVRCHGDVSIYSWLLSKLPIRD